MKKRFLALGMAALLTVTGICGVDTAKYAKVKNWQLFSMNQAHVHD